MIRIVVFWMLLFPLITGAAQRETFRHASARDSLLNVLRRTSLPDTSRVQTLFRLTEIYIQYYDYKDSARLFSEQALELSRKIHYTRGEAWALLYIGKGVNNNPTLSAGYFQQATEIFRALDDKPGLANAYLQIGVILYTQNNLAEAMQRFTQSQQIYESLGDEPHVARLLYLCGLTQSKTGNYKSALLNLQNALNHYIRLGLEKESFESRMGLAEAYELSGLSADALIYHRMCLAYGRANDMPEMSVVSLLGIGRILQREGDAGKTEEAYQEAYALVSNLGSPWRKLQVTDALYKFYEKQGDYNRAFSYLLESRGLQDLLYNEQ